MTTAFDQAIVVTASDRGGQAGPTGPSRFTWRVPAGWEQGRGAWGGLVVGACLEAVQQAGVAADGAEADGSQARPVRTVTAHLMGPVLAGTANVEVAAVRVGSSMSTWSARVLD
ncbi:MAG: acyl-CoA thioesterase domain-containing protein, partial [Actinomycetales bacterium]